MPKFLKTLIPVELAKGMLVTGKHFCQVMFRANRSEKKLHLVDEYPEVPARVQPRFRGRLQLLRDGGGEPLCTCCMLCAKACPTNAIRITAGSKEGRKTRIPLEWDYEMERCVFCGFCVDACNFGAIELNHQFELAVYNRDDLALGLGGAFQAVDRPSPVARFSYSDGE